MSEKEVQAALEPFRQLATSGSWGAGGSGLGLPITKALAEANRAHVYIKSAPYAGTLIEVAFPPTRVVAGYQKRGGGGGGRGSLGDPDDDLAEMRAGGHVVVGRLRVGEAEHLSITGLICSPRWRGSSLEHLRRADRDALHVGAREKIRPGLSSGRRRSSRRSC